MEQYKYDSEDDRFHIDLTRQIHLEMAGLVTCPKGWMGQLHSHPFWELIFFHSGEGEMKMKTASYPVKRGDILLIAPLEPHQFVNTGRDRVENMYIGFGFDIQALGGPDATRPALLKLDPEGDVLGSKLRMLVDSFKTAKSGVRAYQDQALIFEIIYKLMDFIQTHPDLSRDLAVDKNGIIADRAKRFLDSNVHRTISVEEVAAKFFLSPHYFAKKFKAEAGCGIKEYHNKARMAKALDLLKDPLLSVSEVAGKLGFNNVNYFTNKFREFYSLSPTEQRRRLAEIPVAAGRP
jgi:AraC-like DNA-binding protein